jgi:hypothetical protein
VRRHFLGARHLAPNAGLRAAIVPGTRPAPIERTARGGRSTT